MRCGAGVDCKRPEQAVNENTAHTFSGWGFHVRFHPACCSGGEDGMACDRSHPEGWRASDDNRCECGHAVGQHPYAWRTKQAAGAMCEACDCEDFVAVGALKD